LDKFEEVTIKLETSSLYNVNAPMNYSINTKCESMATFLSDENGSINTLSSVFIKGDYYIGVRTMGLFESLRPIQITHSNRITNLKKLPTYNEVEYLLTIYTDNNKARNVKFKRYFAPKSVMHKDIVDYEWKGRLFYMNDDVPTPTILVLSGSDGGIEKAQNIAQSLVSYVFNALALSYF
jgi:thioesterase